MPIIELYSQRRRRETGEALDVVQYAKIPQQLRQQCLYIIADMYGNFSSRIHQEHYSIIVPLLRRELGVRALSRSYFECPGEELEYYILNASDTEALDAIEFCMRLGSSYFVHESGPRSTKIFNRAAEEFNQRCKRAGFGYSFQDGMLIRVDSELLHKEAVIPALVVLADPAFKVADREFRNAHEHWRVGKLPEVLIDCLKAFESTIKIIVAERGWVLPERPTANQLVQALFDNSFLPGFYQSQMGGLRSLLESGIPTPRNRTAGHGGGTEQPKLPAELVRYVLHQTAATILYLVDTHRAGT